MKLLSPVVLIFLLAVFPAFADTLPGFRVETLGSADGFVSSVVVDAKSNVYFTTTSGWIYRLDGGNAVRVAFLPTKAGGNGGLLGMALLDERTAVVHYTTWAPTGEKVLDDVISTVDLITGTERVLKTFACDIHFRDNGASPEHHGGNPTVAPDGSIFVGIGEYGGRIAAQKPEWNGGKIFRIDRDGRTTQWALGMRNPYDLAWDDAQGQIVVADNGPDGGDEIHVIDRDANCGWPDTYGNEPQISGAVAPVYVFEETVAPTGLARLTGANPMFRGGYLLAAFVTRAIYYFPDLAERPVSEPVAVINGYDGFVIDVTQAPDGAIYFATAEFPGTSSIHRLVPPQHGDCNGDGFTDSRDIPALMGELRDGGIQRTIRVQGGAHAGSWGCDVTADGIVDSRDLDQLAAQLMRKRAVRR